ncbi:MAG: energy transducer TonB [Gemmatimonadaceae bacterium]
MLRDGQSTERYALLLLLLIAQRQGPARLAPVLAASSTYLERRILAMRTSPPRHRAARIAASAALAAIAIAAACSTPIADSPTNARPTTDRAITNTPNPEQAYWEYQVSQPALARADNPAPLYPGDLRLAGIEGDVVVQFVVDRDGTPEFGTFKVLRSNNEAFTVAVRAVVPKLRYTPALMAGARVRMVVQQPFIFRGAPSQAK